MVRNLAIAHIQCSHQGTELATWIRRQVPHQPTPLISAIGGFVRSSHQTEEPQPRCR